MIVPHASSSDANRTLLDAADGGDRPALEPGRPSVDHIAPRGELGSTLPWYVRAILVRPTTIGANLEHVCETYGLARPNEWQLCLGILRLWHRLLFRTETVGTSNAGKIRRTWRARALAWRALRLPFLLRERAVVPLDFTGLGSSPERLIRHLLGAHHDENQFVYDLEVLAGYGKLEQLRTAVGALIDRDDDRSRFLRDLTVFEGYHESLRDAVDRAIAHGPAMSAADADDPDISLRAYLSWCAAQPSTPEATVSAWRAGTFRFDSALNPIVRPTDTETTDTIPRNRGVRSVTQRFRGIVDATSLSDRGSNEGSNVRSTEPFRDVARDGTAPTWVERFRGIAASSRRSNDRSNEGSNMPMWVEGSRGTADSSADRVEALGAEEAGRTGQAGRVTPDRARAWSALELAAAFDRGHAFDPDAAAGWIYRGTSLGLPRIVERLSWIKFAKAFHRDGDRVRGWNIRIEQDALDLPWRPQLRRGRAVTFGPFVVVAGHAGLVLDYGLGGGAMRALRDPVVAIDDHADVLLGRSLLQIGPATIPTPSYFLLERDTRVVDPRPA